MTALVRMRLSAFVRGGRALAPAVAALVVLGVIYGGGSSAAAPAYGYSAVMLLPVLAWTAKLLLDTDPDVQRRLARIAVGPARETAAGLLAAATVALVVVAVAMVAPVPFHAIRPAEPGEPSLATGVALGVLAHLLVIPVALGLGALAARAVTRSIRTGLTVLLAGVVLSIVLGLSGSVAPWLAPPAMAMARALNAVPIPGAGTFVLLSAWAVAWSAVAITAYAWLRRTRS